jgi:adenylate kinase family enzyme
VRIAIIGSPRAGKTTLALELMAATGLPVHHTDGMVGLMAWSEVSTEVARLLAEPGDFIVEGVAVVRGLRKAMTARLAVPVERCIVLEWPRLRLTAGQRAMAAGCATMLREIEPELRRRGVSVERPT